MLSKDSTAREQQQPLLCHGSKEKASAIQDKKLGHPQPQQWAENSSTSITQHTFLGTAVSNAILFILFQCAEVEPSLQQLQWPPGTPACFQIIQRSSPRAGYGTPSEPLT